MPKALTDADVVKGGIGGTDGTEDEKKDEKKASDGEVKTVKVAGIDFPADLGDKLNQLVTGFSREIDTLKGQVQAGLVANAHPVKGKKEEAKDEYDYETQLFVNPKEALSRLRSEIKAEILEEADKKNKDRDTKLSAEQSEVEFWREFYSEHKELKDDDIFVRAILNRDFSKLASMKVKDVYDYLAKETKAMLVRHAASSKGDPESKSREVEGAGPGKKSESGKKEEGKDEEIDLSNATLSAFIKSRRAVHRAGGRKPS